MKKKLPIILSVAAIVISIAAILFVLFKVKPIDIPSSTAIEWTVMVLSLLVTMLLAWNLYSSIRLEKIARKYAKKETKRMLHIIRGAQAMSATFPISISPEDLRGERGVYMVKNLFASANEFLKSDVKDKFLFEGPLSSIAGIFNLVNDNTKIHISKEDYNDFHEIISKIHCKGYADNDTIDTIRNMVASKTIIQNGNEEL